MDGYLIAGLIGSLAALFLATRGLRRMNLSFERKAGMAAAWLLIIGVLAFVLTRMGY